MMARCVTLAGSNLYLALDGSVLNAPIMTCVVSVTMAINIIYGTDFTESRHLEVTNAQLNLEEKARKLRPGEYFQGRGL